MTVKGVGNIADSDLEFVSRNPEVATIDANGLIKALKGGEAEIDIKRKSSGTVLLTIIITVLETPGTDRIDALLELLKEANQDVVATLNASLLYDTSSNQQYFKATYGASTSTSSTISSSMTRPT